jgi:cell division protein ZapA
MARVEVTLNGRKYAAHCSDGQEERLQKLAGHVEEKLALISKGDHAGSDAQILALTSLMLADEVFDLREEVAALKARQAELGKNTTTVVSPLAATVDQLARRLEDIAGRIEQS